MPLTQELIADALGLSVPHVNRTLRQLRDDELVSIEEHIVIIKDVEALSALADFDNSYLGQFRSPGLVAETSLMPATVRNMESMPQSTRE
jgi:DNA-binding transcriptional regulator LsrR (DeoR family)